MAHLCQILRFHSHVLLEGRLDDTDSSCWFQELASQSSEHEAQVCKLSQELAEYKAESKELKNQSGTIRRLEERIRSLEAQVQEKVPIPA